MGDLATRLGHDYAQPLGHDYAGGGAYDPLNVSGLQLAMVADAGITRVEYDASQWEDQSPNGYVFPDLANVELRYNGNVAPNGHAAIDFNIVTSAARFRLNDASFQTHFGGAAWSFLIVAPQHTANILRRALSIGNATSGPTSLIDIRPAYGVVITGGGGSSPIPHGQTVTDGDTIIFGVSYDNGDVRMTYNGTPLSDTVTPRALSSLAWCDIGNLLGANQGGNKLAAAYGYDRALSAAELAAFDAWATTEYVGDLSATPYGQVIFGQSNAADLDVYESANGAGINIQNKAVDATAIAGLSSGKWHDDFLLAIQAHPVGATVVIPWSQGEQDALDAGLAAAYQTAFSDLVSATAAACPDQNLVWVVELLHPDIAAAERATVRAAQEAVVAANPSIMTSYNNDDRTLIDAFHYDPDDLSLRRGRLDTTIAAFV